MPYDIFISYAHKDNEPASPGRPGWITAFVQDLIRSHRQLTGEELELFFDQDSIRAGADWELRIGAGLRDSHLLIAFVSPGYFASDWCRREWQGYSRNEIAHFIPGEGILPVYCADVPGFENGQVASNLAEWAGDLRRRQHIDLRSCYQSGPEALARDDTRRILDPFGQQIDVCLNRIRSAQSSPGTTHRHSENFVGRRDEMRQIRKMLATGKAGTIAALNGLGGIGKTALVNEYAHAYAGDYPGGRWLLRCEGYDDLAQVMLQLATPLGITFDKKDDKPKDIELVVQRILNELRERVLANRNKRLREPACLLVFDNVDKPALFSPAQTARLPKEPWLHILATTQLGRGQLFGNQPDREFLALDELPESDALALIERYQPLKRIAEDEERKAALQITRRLGGFTLAIEAVAVYLGMYPEIGCRGFLDRLNAEGYEAPEKVSREESVGDAMRYRRKALSAVLAPTLETLTPEETFALACAALLPADDIPLPWLRALAQGQFPAMAATRPGYPDPWRRVEQRLLDWRLLREGADCTAQGAPRVVRMHRLAQEMVQKRPLPLPDCLPDDLRRRFAEHAKARCLFLKDHCMEWDHRWEIEPLKALSRQMLERGKDETSAWIANSVALRLDDLARHAEAEPLFRESLRIREAKLGANHPDVAESLSNLALLLETIDRWTDAEPLYIRALEIGEASLGPDHPDVAKYLNNLAWLLHRAGRIADAEPLYRRALKIYQQIYPGDHPDTATVTNNLALALNATQRPAEAEPLFRDALAMRERCLDAGHPEVATSLNNRAMWLRQNHHESEAEPLYRRALAIFERSYGPDHPNVASTASSLATLLRLTNRLAEAEQQSRRSLDINERHFGPDHTSVASSLNNLAIVLQAANRLPEAVPLLRRALEIRERQYGPNHPDVAATLRNLARMLQAAGETSEAESLLARIQETAKQ